MSFWCDFGAGWFGGVVGLVVGHPFDTLKVNIILWQPRLLNMNMMATLLAQFGQEVCVELNMHPSLGFSTAGPAAGAHQPEPPLRGQDLLQE